MPGESHFEFLKLCISQLFMLLFGLTICGEPAIVTDEECFNLYVVLRVISELPL